MFAGIGHHRTTSFTANATFRRNREMTHSIRTRVEGEQYDENSSVQVASAVMQPGERRERRDNRHKC